MSDAQDKTRRRPAVLEAGAILGGCRLDRPLGAGGMGEVWLARQLSLDRSVAVKVLPAELARDPAFADRFRREALLAAKVRSPYVVETHDAAVDGGLAFIVMEFLEGETLMERIQGGRPMGEARALQILLHAARGLHAAHEAGLVHRDVKPANIFLQKKGPAKLLDFGLAQTCGQESGLTEPGVVMGTPHFMSPEQCEGAPAGPPSDLYSLGASLYAALAGRPPFTAETAVAVMRLHLDREPERLRALRPDVSLETENLVLRLLEKDPASRPASALAVAREADRRIHALAGSPLDGTAVQPRQSARANAAPGRRRSVAAWAVAGVFAAVATIGLLLWGLNRSVPEVRPGDPATTSSRFLTLSVRTLPDASRGAEYGTLEITVRPKPGLYLSSSHGESHGHKHGLAEFGIDLSAPAEVRLDRSEINLPEIRATYAARVAFRIDAQGGAGRYPVKVAFRYQAMESAASIYEPDKVELSAEVLYE